MSERSSPPGTGAEVALVAAGTGIVGVGVATWLGARLAALTSGGHVAGGFGDWLTVAVRLARGERPSTAWGPLATGLPGESVYWSATVIVLAVMAAAAGGLFWAWHRIDPARRERLRFGQDTSAHQARPRDVRPLVVDDLVPPTGRMLLGRLAPRGPLLATEDRDRHPLSGRSACRQGNRGSVALIGPTGSGKTALATSAIATWNGPVVAVSVKRDLYDTTVAARATKGEIAVFDPGGATGLPTARWSPLEATTTSTGALRTGRALAQAIPKGGVTNAEYWAEHGEALLGAFMCVAGLSRLIRHPDGTPIHHVGMEQLAAWVRTLAVATEPTINDLLSRSLQKDRPLEVQLLGRHAAVTFVGVAKEDHKIRSSVYSTAVLALKPWLEPAVAHSASTNPHHDYTAEHAWVHVPRYLDLDWLMDGDGANTLYLAAPSAEFERLSPVLGGLLADLKDTIHAWDIAGNRIPKPLLIVIDEAAQLQLGWLPTEVSTIAALDAFFVTCWQNLAQINHRYGTLADAVLSGHRTKCFFAGIDDPATSRYLTGLLGHERVTRRSHSHDVPTGWGNRQQGRRSVSESTQREELAPAHTIREMIPGQAVLLHGTLPPIHLDAIRWWNEPQLASIIPTDDHGKPVPPDAPTCPLTDQKAPESTQGAVDLATLERTRRQLPKPIGPDEGFSVGTTGTGSGSDTVQDRSRPDSNGPSDSYAPIVRAVRGRCQLCREDLGEGDGRLDVRGGRSILRCAPSCSERSRIGRGRGAAAVTDTEAPDHS